MAAMWDWILNILKIVGILTAGISSWPSSSADDNKPARHPRNKIVIAIIGLLVALLAQVMDTWQSKQESSEKEQNTATVMTNLQLSVDSMQRMITRFNDIAVTATVQMNINQPSLLGIPEIQKPWNDLFEKKHQSAVDFLKKNPSLRSIQPPLDAIFPDSYKPADFQNSDQAILRDFIEHLSFHLDFYRTPAPAGQLDPAALVGQGSLYLKVSTNCATGPTLTYDFKNKILSIAVRRAGADFQGWDSNSTIPCLYDFAGTHLVAYSFENFSPINISDHDFELVVKLLQATTIANASVRFDSMEIPLTSTRTIQILPPLGGQGVLYDFPQTAAELLSPKATAPSALTDPSKLTGNP